MQKLVKLSFVGLAALFISATTVFVVHAQQANDQLISEEQIELIRQNCISAQVAMQRVQRSDVVTRTNRGRGYEATASLMASFNSRVAYNKLNEPVLTEVTNQLNRRFKEFSERYTRYQEAMDDALKVNCQQQPTTFYDALIRTRELRRELAVDIEEMNKHIVRYDQAVTNLRERVKSGQVLGQREQ